jgi:hypothetical protein
LKCRNKIVPPLFVEHEDNVEREEPGRHTTCNTALRILVRHFPDRLPPTDSKYRPTLRCVTGTIMGRR